MSEEKIKILEMIQGGKISAAEGMELLNALNETDEKPRRSVSSSFSNRFFRVKVDNSKAKVNVNIPLSLIKATSKIFSMGMGLIPDEARREMEKKGIDITKLDIEELVDLIDRGLVDGKLVDVDAEDPEHGRTKVEVYVE